jgi:hypothetical protein
MPKTTKRFALTPAQAQDLRESFSSLEMAGEIIAEMVLKLSEKHAKKHQLTWESVAEILGVQRDLFTSAGSGVAARINYLTNEVILTGATEDLDAALPHIPFHD